MKVNNADLFFSLKTMPNEVENLLNCFPTDKLHWKPASWEGNPGENFSAIEQICHLRDIEIDGYHYRINAMLTEHKPILKSVEGYQLANDRQYENSNLSDVIANFRLARETTIHLISTIQISQFDNIGFFEGYGNITLRALIHFLCSHDFEHLASLRWLLGKMKSANLQD